MCVCDFHEPVLFWGRSHIFSFFLWPICWFPAAQMQCLHQSLGPSVLYPQLSFDAASKLPACLSQVNKYSCELWRKRQWKMVSFPMLFPGCLTEFLIFCAVLPWHLLSFSVFPLLWNVSISAQSCSKLSWIPFLTNPIPSK